jgi:4-hydroxybenzoate polyprenyltransferase
VNEPAGTAVVGDAGRGKLRAWIDLVRPKQWIKNTFVLAPLLFSGRALQPDAQLRAAAAFLLFSLASGAAYAFNDVLDRRSDSAHPTKRLRPVASGLIAPAHALLASLVLTIVAVAGGWLLSPALGSLLVLYVALNGLYGVSLKRIVIVDVFAIAAFFVLRLVTGSAAVGVRPSVWLLMCGGLLALYLGLAKRRRELSLLGSGSHEHRNVLSQYSVALLDQLSTVLLAVTIVSYVMYTRESETAQKVGSDALSYSAAFVLFGVFRYVYLVHRGEGGDPADTLLADRWLLGAGLLWVLYCGLVVYRPF